jgi:hypothetical protein
MLFHRRGEAERQADEEERVTKKEKWRKKTSFFLVCKAESFIRTIEQILSLIERGNEDERKSFFFRRKNEIKVELKTSSIRLLFKLTEAEWQNHRYLRVVYC